MNTFKNSINSQKNEIRKDFLFIISFGSIIYYLLINKLIDTTGVKIDILNLPLLYFCYSIAAGWRTLDNIKAPNSLIGIIFHILIKVTISSIIGCFVFPFRVINNIKKYIA